MKKTDTRPSLILSFLIIAGWITITILLKDESPILKHNTFPLAALVTDLLESGHQGMGGPVEIEFAVQLPRSRNEEAVFHLLQIRPMPQFEQQAGEALTARTKEEALCFSNLALGNGRHANIADIVLVDPESFDPARTVDIAAEIGRLNADLGNAGRRFILIGDSGERDPEIYGRLAHRYPDQIRAVFIRQLDERPLVGERTRKVIARLSDDTLRSYENPDQLAQFCRELI